MWNYVKLEKGKMALEYVMAMIKQKKSSLLSCFTVTCQEKFIVYQYYIFYPIVIILYGRRILLRVQEYILLRRHRVFGRDSIYI